MECLQCAQHAIYPNKNVFKERLKSWIDVVCRKCSGIEFQAWGPAYENARRP